MSDARFEDAAERPIRLRAESPEDLEVVSALLQDAAGVSGDLAWMRRKRRFALFLNRFRWEDRERAERAGRAYERVRCAVLVENVESVKSAGLSPADREQVVAVLRMEFAPSPDPEDPSGLVRIVLAGDGEIAIAVEALEIRVEDVTRPYVAPSGKAPSHLDD